MRRQRKVAFGPRQHPSSAVLVLECGDLDQRGGLLGPVLELGVEQEDELGMIGLLEGQGPGVGELPDRPADGEGEVGRPGVDGVDRESRRDPLADGTSPGALTASVVPLGDVVAGVCELQADGDGEDRRQGQLRLALPDRLPAGHGRRHAQDDQHDGYAAVVGDGTGQVGAAGQHEGDPEDDARQGQGRRSRDGRPSRASPPRRGRSRRRRPRPGRPARGRGRRRPGRG